MTPALSEERQRIDKWLWFARIVRTRNAAAQLVASGHVRLNGARIDTPGRSVKPGDVLTIALDRRVRVLKIMAFSARRGSAADTGGLYEDLSPPAPAREPRPQAGRSPGAGRPTKRERRAMARFTGGGDD